MSYIQSQEKIIESINVDMTEGDTRHKYDYKNYRNFLGTVMIVFDMNPEMLWHLQNLDYLWRPNTENKNLNYIQWLTSPTSEREPVDEVLCYIFKKGDPRYGDPYERSKREHELRKEHLEKIEEEYGGRNKYLESVAERLWQEKDYLNYYKV